MARLLRSRRRKLVVLGFALLVFAVALSLLAGWWLIAPARRPRPRPPKDLPVEVVRFASHTGSPCHGWWIPADPAEHAKPRGAIILAHAVRGWRKSMMGRARFLHSAGYSCLVFDFQAHGESPGDAITFGDRESEDLRGAVDFVKARAPALPRTVIGWSLGGAAALLAQPPLEIDALILEEVYATFDEALRARTERFGPLASLAATVLLTEASWFGVDRKRLRPIDNIENYDNLLILAASQDRHTPLEQSLRLYKASQGKAELEIFSGAEHVDLHRFDPETYEQLVLHFLEVRLAR